MYSKIIGSYFYSFHTIDNQTLLLLLLSGCSNADTDIHTQIEPEESAPTPRVKSGNGDIDTDPQPTPEPIIQSTPTPTLTPTPMMHDPIVIGTTVAERPMEVFQFGTGDTYRMIIAGIHGGYEGNTIHLADQMIQVLQARPDLIPEETTLYILRSLNPDGEARSNSYKGRVNENLVDLNRNWPSHWQKTWPLEGCWTYTYVTGGSHPASEPETRALMNFLITYQIEALINYHSAALGIFPGGQPPDPASIRLAEAIASASNYPYPPIDTGCIFTGQLIDWASPQFADHKELNAM